MTLPPGRVDIHSHLIPALDDGPDTLETAIEVVRLAAIDGTAVMVATSHSDEVRASRLDKLRLDSRLDEVRQAVAAHGIGVTLLVGVEVFLDLETAKLLRDGTFTTLNASRYALVEPPMSMLADYFDEALFRVLAAGYTPIIAHPERNISVRHDPSRMYAWASKGALLQVTAGSLLGQSGNRAARIAMEGIGKGWIRIVASDAHHPTRRPPQLAEAQRAVAAAHGEDLAQQLFDDNPRAVVEDRELPPTAIQEPDTGSSSRTLWRHIRDR